MPVARRPAYAAYGHSGREAARPRRQTL